MAIFQNETVTDGPERESLIPEQREIDSAARLSISRELGPTREAMVSAYLNR